MALRLLGLLGALLLCSNYANFVVEGALPACEIQPVQRDEYQVNINQLAQRMQFQTPEAFDNFTARGLGLQCSGGGYCFENGPCWYDQCSPDGCTCNSYRRAAGTTCSNGLFCDGEETCDGNGNCLAGTPPCSGGGQCNSQCNEASNNCYQPTTAVCNDGLFCTATDRCNGFGACVGTNDPCAGGATCKTICNEAANNCNNPSGTSCNDGLYCNGVETCNGAGTCVSSGNPCGTGAVCDHSCNEASNNCFAPAGTACAADAFPCTNDICNGAGSCTHPTTDGAACNDGNTCTSNDRCSGQSCSGDWSCGCMTNAECDDNNLCTNDVCNVVSGVGTCAYTNNVAPCNDGLFCNGVDSCSGGTCSVHQGNPCPVGNPCAACNENGNSCIAAAGTSCDDGLFCTGTESCNGNGLCVSSGDPCVSGSVCNTQCNEDQNNCFNPQGQLVEDGNFCNGEEYCDGAGVRVEPGNPCSNNENPCGRDCIEATDSCSSPSGTPCPDGIWCNGLDFCDQGVCLHTGSPCQDGSTCDLQCNEEAETCANFYGVPCESDGVFCNGPEVCDGLGSCISFGDPCLAISTINCNFTCSNETSSCLVSGGDFALCSALTTNSVDLPTYPTFESESGSSGSLPPPFTGASIGEQDGAQEANKPGSSPAMIGGIGGGVGGLLLIVVLVALLVFFLVRRRKNGKGALTQDVELHAPSARGTTYSGIPVPGAPTGYGPSFAPPIVPPRSSFSPYKGMHDDSPNVSNGSLSSVGRNSANPVVPARLPQISRSASTLQQTSWEIPYGQLHFDKEIGSGAFGKVFLGRWRGGVVAIKTLLDQTIRLDQSELQAFQAEAALMARLRPHANVVQFLGVCSQSGSPLCIVTEYMKGGSLFDVVRSQQEIDDPTMLQWIKGIAYGMLHLHSENIVHRDLAIRNVLLGDENVVKITDFGMSRATESTSSSAKTTAEVGPLKYMAIESLMDKTYSSKSDVWSFSITVIEILTREDPYPTLDTVAAATKVTHGLRPTVPDWVNPQLVQLLNECWSVSPTARPDFEKICARLEYMTHVSK